MPLPAETLKKIKEDLRASEKALKEIEPEIQKAITAGIDVTEQLKIARELRAKIDKMRLVYGE